MKVSNYWKFGVKEECWNFYDGMGLGQGFGKQSRKGGTSSKVEPVLL